MRVMGLKAACALMAFVSRTPHIMTFRNVVPLMYDVVAECANPNVCENTAAALGLECFVDLALSPAPVLKGQVALLPVLPSRERQPCGYYAARCCATGHCHFDGS